MFFNIPWLTTDKIIENRVWFISWRLKAGQIRRVWWNLLELQGVSFLCYRLNSKRQGVLDVGHRKVSHVLQIKWRLVTTQQQTVCSDNRTGYQVKQSEIDFTNGFSIHISHRCEFLSNEYIAQPEVFGLKNNAIGCNVSKDVSNALHLRVLVQSRMQQLTCYDMESKGQPNISPCLYRKYHITQ